MPVKCTYQIHVGFAIIGAAFFKDIGHFRLKKAGK